MKKLSALVLALILVFSLGVTARADGTDKSLMYIDGKSYEFTSDAGGENWSWDADTCTLTLNGFTYDGQIGFDNPAAPMTLVLAAGTVNYARDGIFTCMWIDEDLPPMTITGGGTLNADGQLGGDFEIVDATVTAEGNISGGLIMRGGSLTCGGLYFGFGGPSGYYGGTISADVEAGQPALQEYTEEPGDFKDVEATDAAGNKLTYGLYQENTHRSYYTFLNADGTPASSLRIGDTGSTQPTDPVAPEAPETPEPPTTPAAPATGTAYASTQNVSIDGKAVELQAYALKDESGNPTNYVKLRDVAYALNGTAAQFEVGWDGSVNILTGSAYTPNGTEMTTPFSGDRAYTVPTAGTNVNGAAAGLAAISLTDDSGGGYTYYQLRDLGKALGFNVGWSAERGIFIETDKPYTDAD